MNNKEIRKILAERFVDSNGYKNPMIKKEQISNVITGFIFTLAPILVMGIFIFFTMIYGLTFITSKGQLTADLSGIKQSTFLANFAKLGKDILFKKAVSNTFIFSLIVFGFFLLFDLYIWQWYLI